MREVNRESAAYRDRVAGAGSTGRAGIPMVVEGVEKLEQSEEMERLGVEYIQGYYYGKPLPEMECLRYIRNFNSAPEDYGR